MPSRTNVRGYVIYSDQKNQRGIVQEYGRFPSSADPEYAWVDLGQYPFNGFVFDKDAAVIWDVAENVVGARYAVNLRPQ